MATLESPFGTLQLQRWPVKKKDNLRAWDAADELILRHLDAEQLLSADCPARVLLINDGCGALACALHHWQPVSWTDSSIGHNALRENLRLNGVAEDSAIALTSIENPTGTFDIVLIKVPKITAMLEDQLIRLRACLHDRSKVIAGGMVKHLQPAAFDCIEKTIGPTTTSLAVKKARLIFASLDLSLAVPANPYPSVYLDPLAGFELSNHASLFSREKLDVGTGMLLAQYPALPAVDRFIDLACGNGVLGIMYQARHPDAAGHFIDESYMAVDSARSNWHARFTDSKPTARFEAADGLTTVPTGATDLILCNPPFHQQHVLDRGIAQTLFEASKRCLAQGGELWVVANHHLGYHVMLRRLFGNCRTVATSKKFVVLRAVKRHVAA